MCAQLSVQIVYPLDSNCKTITETSVPKDLLLLE
jgi:hypothetical protein